MLPPLQPVLRFEETDKLITTVVELLNADREEVAVTLKGIKLRPEHVDYLIGVAIDSDRVQSMISTNGRFITYGYGACFDLKGR